MAWQARLSLAVVLWARPSRPLGLSPKIEGPWERGPGAGHFRPLKPVANSGFLEALLFTGPPDGGPLKQG